MSSFWSQIRALWAHPRPRRAKRRSLAMTIETCEERVLLSGASLSNVNFSPLPPPAINGFEQSASGDFDGDGQADDIFAWNGTTGANRFVVRDGNNFVFTTNAIAPGAINGRDFVHVVSGSYDGNATMDLFFWNSVSGRNRLAHLNSTRRMVTASVETNVVPTGAINGNDFEAISSGRFSDGENDGIFFWNPATGRNRFSLFVTATAGQNTDLIRIETDFVDPRGINGNAFQLVRAGNFSASSGVFESDELVFVNLTTGDVRIFKIETFKIPLRNGTFKIVTNTALTSDVVNPLAFNGNLFQQVVVGNYNNDSLDDIFLWNEFTGQNRIGFAVGLRGTESQPELRVESDCVPPGAVNGTYSSVISIEESGVDSLFFVSLNTGLNRLVSA